MVTSRLTDRALTPPNWNPHHIIGIRKAETKALVGFVAGIPDMLTVRGHLIQAIDTNFLCVDRSMRGRRIVPVLVNELTRRSRRSNIFMSLYTSVTRLSPPMARAKYWNRCLNPERLIRLNFLTLPPKITLSLYTKAIRLDEETKTLGFRPMEVSDVPMVCSLINRYQSQFSLAKNFSDSDVYHHFVSAKSVIFAYVVEVFTFFTHQRESVLVDFISFFMNNLLCLFDEEENIKTAYLYYYASFCTPLNLLVNDALVEAKNKSCDLFVATDLMNNLEFLDRCHFVESATELNYYLYNRRCPPFKRNQASVVLP